MSPRYPAPPARRLRVYAFDPQTASRLGSINYAFATISLAWGTAPEDELRRRSISEYVEVIDVDPASRQCYDPVNLNIHTCLRPTGDSLRSESAIPPADGLCGRDDSHSHLRASARPQSDLGGAKSGTIGNFDRVRDGSQAAHISSCAARGQCLLQHGEARPAVRLFPQHRRIGRRELDFTALSHDIIAHETTHAVLDGLHRRYAEATNVDSLAFHEAFADIVALMSHFTLTEAVSAHIQEKGGSLDQAGLLSGLAEQFARGTVGRTSLRQYVGHAPKPELLAGPPSVTTEAPFLSRPFSTHS